MTLTDFDFIYMFGKQKRGESLSYLCPRNSGATHLLSSVENPTLYFLGTSLITVVGKVGTSLDSLLRNAGTCLSEPDFWLEIHLSEVGGGSQTSHTSFFISISRSLDHCSGFESLNHTINMKWFATSLLVIKEETSYLWWYLLRDQARRWSSC